MLVLDHVRDGKAYKNPVHKKSCVEEKRAILVTYREVYWKIHAQDKKKLK